MVCHWHELLCDWYGCVDTLRSYRTWSYTTDIMAWCDWLQRCQCLSRHLDLLLGPKIRRMSEDAFSTTDFGRKRYGRVMQLTISAVSIFYMFIFIVAELTSISNVFALLTSDYSTTFGIIVTVVLGAFTLFYTGLAGLPASIVTDKFQGLIVALMVIMLTLAVTTNEENHVNREEWELGSQLDHGRSHGSRYPRYCHCLC